jgi:hypothetical protein
MKTPSLELATEPMNTDIVAYTKATREAVANAQLANPVSAVPQRWLMAIAGDIEQVDTTGTVGVASWPASHRVLSFSAAAGVQLGLTAFAPEEGGTPLQQLRRRVTGVGMLGMPNTEGSDEFASVDELLRAATYLKQREVFMSAVQHRAHVVTQRVTSDVAVRRRFGELVAQWHSETALESSVNRKAMNWAYQQIIGIGPDVLPLILAELERETDDWFWALAAIVGEDPAEGAETLDSAAEAWLDWGRRKGYLGESAG